jgi:hypothetical protein
MKPIGGLPIRWLLEASAGTQKVGT